MTKKVKYQFYRNSGDPVIGLREDGNICKMYLGYEGWLSIGKRFKNGADAGAESLKSKGWKSCKVPSLKTLQKWSFDGVAKTPCGCRVEPDGHCHHGNESWLLILGII